MSSVFFLEFAGDVPSFLEHWDSGDIVVALRPEVASELEIRGIPYKCLRMDYYTHEEYMVNSSDCRRQLKPILQALDKETWRHNPQYKLSRIKPFEMFMYPFMSLLGSLRTEIFDLDKLFSKENINKVKLIKHKMQPINKIGASDLESLYERLIYLMQQKCKYEVEAIDGKYESVSDLAGVSNPASRSFYTWKNIYFIRQIKELIRKFYVSKNNSLNNLNKKGDILSVNCKELLCIKQELIALGWSVHQFPNNILDHNSSLYKGHNGLIDEFEKNRDLMKLFEFSGITFFSLIKDRLECFCQNLGTIFNNYQILLDYINDSHFDIVFFSTHSSFEVQNVMLPLICQERKIPYVCWMHGGYGANYTVSGYDLSDYTFGQHYFVYGEEVKKMIDSYYSQYNLITHVTGSPRILRCYQNYVLPTNNKKVITIVTGPYGTNRLHINMDSPYYRFSYWHPLKAILEMLIQYRYKYRIIIRGGRNKGRSKFQKEMFEIFLNHYNAKEIEIMPVDEIPFEEIVKITDLFINLWVSTPFWEACLTHADIFLMDNSDLSDAAKEIIPKRAFWYDNLTEFIQGLQQYLEQGIFYQKSQDKSFLRSYMDFDRKDHIPEHVSRTIEDIIKNGYNDKRT